MPRLANIVTALDLQRVATEHEKKDLTIPKE